MEAQCVRIKILHRNGNPTFRLIDPMMFRTTRAPITVIPDDVKAVGVTIIGIIIIGDGTNSIIRIVPINRTHHHHPHHQISNRVDRTKDDNGSASQQILMAFEFYDFLFNKFCGMYYSHRLVLWLLVYIWCIINSLWFSSGHVQCMHCAGRIIRFSSIVFCVNF